MQLEITNFRHDPDPYWIEPLPEDIFDTLRPQDLDLFDQNGYDLTVAEQLYADIGGYRCKEHRYRRTCKSTWMVDLDNSIEGPHINHADIYFRRAFAGDALEQILKLAAKWPIYHKLSRMRPKWGIDLSVDYADSHGRVFELLHFEWDDFNLPVVLEKKTMVEELVGNINWEIRANEMIERKDEWHHLDFFGQSDWKQQFWGLPKEQFKEVIWK